MPDGYYRSPTIHDETVVFTCEDDLWTVPSTGGIARRLTSGLGAASSPLLSPDGTQIAFVGREEGESEIYMMPAAGGAVKRLTFLGSSVINVAAWNQDGEIVFSSNAGQPFFRVVRMFRQRVTGGAAELINLGPAHHISFGPEGGTVIARAGSEPARWKRYRGGRAGQFWIDRDDHGDYQPLLDLPGNLAAPLWIGARIYFISDHEGIGNIYSCLTNGEDLQRHSDHANFYARAPSSDGTRIVYHAGADLYLFDPQSENSLRIEVELHSPQTQRQRKFVSAARNLQGWDLHPKGHALAITSRGKAYTFSNWEGAVRQHGERDGVRYRLLRWLHDGERLIGISDADGEERLVTFHTDDSQTPELLPELDTGRIVSLLPSPKRDQIVFSNHRYELMFLDLETNDLTLIERGQAGRMWGFDWSPDGNWVAYSVRESLQRTSLRIWERQSGETHPLTEPLIADVLPAFDPKGKYLFFLSYRQFNPVYDSIQFDLNFPYGMRPYLITLKKDLPSPFIPQPMTEEEKDEAAPKQTEASDDDAADSEEEPVSEEADASAEDDDSIEIDLDGIQNRILAFPVADGKYGRIRGLKDGRVMYSRFPVEGVRDQPPSWLQTEPLARGNLYTYDFSSLEEDSVVSRLTEFDVTRDGAMLTYQSGHRLRVLKATEKPNNRASSAASRKSGWISLRRIRVSVLPIAEWRQMFREAWRLQRDHFWTPNMSAVDWNAVHDTYLPLVDRVGSRSEFSDLMWEMQGELGTSHAYEIGGDYRPEPTYSLGHLGADFDYDVELGTWRIAHIVQGDSWEPDQDSPLNSPAINLSIGDKLLAINGHALDGNIPPGSFLVNMAGTEVTLTVQSDEDESSRTITVKTLRNESPARYREWVEYNRNFVHTATDGRVGYVHIPDMGAQGYAEFHRGFLKEIEYEGLIVDVRFNRGGHVSDLLLEKLSRRRIGYDVNRWGAQPEPYPRESVIGPIVALTNEYSGSDGDIFSHSFKLMGLGPLIGKRTWGGVIGISPSQTLVDGTMTTQPEFSFWFEDVGWNVENYGTDPDIELDNTPADFARGVDAQLDRTIEEVMKLLAANPPSVPIFDNRPNLALPKLPPRET